jgi:predicted Zn finger-like uncharacterized protein
MIISCPNCIKKFNIDEKLIPINGRLLQCSSCKHRWHYDLPKDQNIVSELSKDEITEDTTKVDLIKINPAKSNDEIKSKIKKKQKVKKTRKKKIKEYEDEDSDNIVEPKNTSRSFFNILLIIIITFIALILVLDTFKNNLSDYFPFLIPALNNFYEIMFDISSFIKDLIK